MKNKELIAKLQELDPEATVIIGPLEEDYQEGFEVRTVELRVVKRVQQYWAVGEEVTPCPPYFRKPFPKETKENNGLEEVVLIDVT